MVGAIPIFCKGRHAAANGVHYKSWLWVDYILETPEPHGRYLFEDLALEQGGGSSKLKMNNHSLLKSDGAGEFMVCWKGALDGSRAIAKLMALYPPEILHPWLVL